MKWLALACALLPLAGGSLASCASEEVKITFVLTTLINLGGANPYPYLAGDLHRVDMTFPEGFVPSAEDSYNIGRELTDGTPLDLYPEDLCPWYTAGAGTVDQINYSRYLTESFFGTPIEEERECYYTLTWNCWMVGPPDGWEGDWPPPSSSS